MLSYTEKQLFEKFYTLCNQYDGLVAAKVIYTWKSIQGMCSRKEWVVLRDKLISANILIVADKHDAARKVCTQWCLHHLFIQGTEDRTETRGNMRSVIETREREEKKEKQYMPTPSRVLEFSQSVARELDTDIALDGILGDIEARMGQPALN